MDHGRWRADTRNCDVGLSQRGVARRVEVSGNEGRVVRQEVMYTSTLPLHPSDGPERCDQALGCGGQISVRQGESQLRTAATLPSLS